MIIPESETSESKVPTVRSGESEMSSHNPLVPPPYSATIASSDDQRERDQHTHTHSHAPQSSQPDLPPPCNYFIQRKTNASVSGTWHVDTALAIPELLLPPITEYDGSWNQDIQKARKLREKEMKRREKDGRRSPLPMVPEIRPNLMLGSTNGSIRGDIHIVSSDGLTRQAVIVVQGTNGTISLNIHAPDHPLRVYATSTNGSVTIRVPMSFEGVITTTTTWGSIKMSDAIKAKLTTFSSTSNTTRGFIGDWSSSLLGLNPQLPSPNDDPPLPNIESDPFISWTGPLIHLGSTNGSLSLSFIEEAVPYADPLSFIEGMVPSVQNNFSRAVKSWISGLFGGRASANDASGPETHPDSHQATSSSGSTEPRADSSWPGDVKRGHSAPNDLD